MLSLRSKVKHSVPLVVDHKSTAEQTTITSGGVSVPFDTDGDDIDIYTYRELTVSLPDSAVGVVDIYIGESFYREVEPGETLTLYPKNVVRIEITH